MTNADVRRLVIEKLESLASLDASGIGVAVEADGVVTLTGHVPSRAAMEAAEAAVKTVPGVRAVANDVVIRAVLTRDDTTIAEAVLDAIRANVIVPNDPWKIVVEHGWVVIEGEADREYERRLAERAVRLVPGVAGVTNAIVVKVPLHSADGLARVSEKTSESTITA